MLCEYVSAPQVGVLEMNKKYSCPFKRLKTVTPLFKERCMQGKTRHSTMSSDAIISIGLLFNLVK